MDHQRSNPDPVYRFGECRLDTAERTLRRGGAELPLTPTLFEILRVLVENAGRILDKDRLMARVWAGRIVEEGNLARNVSTLRKLLRDDPQHPRYIETIARRGYRFVAAVELVVEGGRPETGRGVEPESLPVHTASMPPSSEAAASPSSADVAVAASVSHGPTRRRFLPAAGSRLVGVAGISACIGVFGAILVFPSIGPGPATTGTHPMSVRPIDNLSADPDGISIADDMPTELVRPLDRAAARSPDPDAYNTYLRGLREKSQQSLTSLHQAIASFAEAIEREPEFPEALAAKGDAFIMLASWQGPSRRLWPEAYALAGRALAVDDTLVLAHLVRAGFLLCHDLNHHAADEAFQLALQFKSDDALAHTRYGYSLATQGRFNDAIKHGRRAVEINPDSPAYHVMLAKTLFFAGRHGEARRQLESVFQFNNAFPEAYRTLGRIELQAGRHEAAIAAFHEAFALSGGPGVLGELAYAYGISGQREEALGLLGDLLARTYPNPDTAFSIALLYHGLGDTARALEWLHKAYDERDFRMVLLLVDPIWDDIRDDPGFQQLLLHIGLRSDSPA